MLVLSAGTEILHSVFKQKILDEFKQKTQVNPLYVKLINTRHWKKINELLEFINN